MKLFSRITIAIVIATSFISASLGYAENKWTLGYATNDGSTRHFKIISRNGSMTTFRERSSIDSDQYTRIANCKDWRVKYEVEGEQWVQVLPQTYLAMMIKKICL